MELRSFKRALTLCASRRRTDVPANPDAVEALLDKAQSVLDGLRSTWERRDVQDMTDAAEEMEITMRELIDEVLKEL
jgi:hypothetical protein